MEWQHGSYELGSALPWKKSHGKDFNVLSSPGRRPLVIQVSLYSFTLRLTGEVLRMLALLETLRRHRMREVE
jgi:hypothetical protein